MNSRGCIRTLKNYKIDDKSKLVKKKRSVKKKKNPPGPLGALAYASISVYTLSLKAVVINCLSLSNISDNTLNNNPIQAVVENIE